MIDYKKLLDFFKGTPRPKLILFGSVIVIFVIITLVFFVNYFTFYTGEDTVTGKIEALSKMNLKLKKLRLEVNSASKDSIQKNDVWVQEISGDPKLMIWKKLEEKSSDCGIVLKNFGNLQEIKINKSISGYELTIDTEASLEKVCNFIVALSESTPRFFWTSLALRPNNTSNPNAVIFSGVLKVVVVPSERTLKGLWD